VIVHRSDEGAVTITSGLWPPRRNTPLLILSLDTTTRAGSVAIVRDDTILAELTGDPAVTHGARLPSELQRALEAAEVRIAEIDLVAVGAGPGSFTGLRVGISTVQGLAFARGLKVVPVSNLDALAHESAERVAGALPIGAWIDAQRGEVFATLYDPAGRAVIVPPSSLSPAETLATWRDVLGSQGVIFAGDGAVRYASVIRERLGDRAHLPEGASALAGVIGRLAAREPDRAVAPHAVIPVYVRRPDAEIARDQRQASRDGPRGAGEI